MTSNFKKPDALLGAIDLDDEYVTDSWLIDQFNQNFTAGGLFVSYNGSPMAGASGPTYNSPVQVGVLTNWKQVTSSGLAIKTDGTLWGCYNNSYGILGNGTTVTSYSSPVQIGSLTNWKTISSNTKMAAAIKTDGTLWTWGINRDGSLGNNNTVYYSSPIQVGALTNWKSVSVGEGFADDVHVLAIKTDGTLWAWGYNVSGQLGNGTTLSYSSPIQIGSMTDWKYISCGGDSSGAIKNNGTLWTWGYNSFFQLGLGNAINYSSPVQVGSSNYWKEISMGGIYNPSFALKRDGTLWAWGRNLYGGMGTNTVEDKVTSPIQIGTINNWKTIKGSDPNGFFSGIRSDGSLWVCGNGSGALLGSSSITYSSPVQVGINSYWRSMVYGFYGIRE